MLDCWKNSCQGATVVPTMAIISRTEVELAPPAIPGTNSPCTHRAGLRVAEDDERDDQEIAGYEDEHEPFPAPEAPGGRHGHQAERGDRDRDVVAHPEITEGKGDADELGDDREEIQDEQVADGETGPEPAEPLLDQPAVADTGHGAQAHDHFLVDDEHRDQKRKHPQEAGAVVLARLRVRSHPAGVIVPDHDDKPWPDDGGEREQAGAPRPAGSQVLFPDRPKGSLDVPEMGFIEHGRGAVERAEAHPACRWP